jgi:predicted outer membrane repeat protein
VRSTFSGNHADGDGGAIDSNGELIIDTSTVSGNVSPHEGGGIYMEPPSTISNSTIAGNTGSFGGNLRAAGGGTVDNTILALSGGGGNCQGTLDEATNDLLDSAAGCVITTKTGVITGKDPKLGPLEADGGPTATRALLAGSPAVGKGAASICEPTDQRGVHRPQGSRCDIGAYEMPVPTVTKPAASNVHTAHFTVAWGAPGATPGIGTFDVRSRSKPLGGSFGSFHAFRSGTTAHQATFTAEFGRQYCFSARVNDPGGNASRYGPERCVSVTH